MKKKGKKTKLRAVLEFFFLKIQIIAIFLLSSPHHESSLGVEAAGAVKRGADEAGKAGENTKSRAAHTACDVIYSTFLITSLQSYLPLLIDLCRND